MAEQATINLNVKTDESQKSLRAMRQELKQLQIAMDAASDPAEFKRLEAEFATLRNDMADTSQAMKYMDPGELLSGWTKFAQGAVGAFSAITGAMSLFGSESEAIQEIEKKSMVLIQTMMGLEQAHQLLIAGGGRAQIAQIIETTGLQIKQAAATAAQAIATKGYTMATEGATVATRLMGKVMTSVPFIAIAAAIAGVVIGIANMVNNIKSANEESFRMKKYTEQLITEFSKEAAHLRTVGKAVLDAKVGTQERADAVSSLNEQYKDYLPNLLDEKSSNEDIAAALDIVNQKLMENMITKMRTTALDELYAKQVEAELIIIDKQTRQQEQLKKAEDARRAGRDTEAKQYETNAKVFDDGIQVQKDALKDLDSEIAKAEAAFDKLAAKYKVSTKPVPPPGGSVPPPTTTPTQVDLDNLADFYGEYFKELERHNKTIANINEAFRTGQIKSKAEYDERIMIETTNHNKKIAELELNDREDLDLQLSDAAKKKLEADKKAKADAILAAQQAAEAEAMRMEFEREKQQKIQEGWYADEILKREGNFSKRLGMLKDFHDRGLILEEDYKKAVIGLIGEQVNKYSDFANSAASSMGDVFSNLTETAQMELDAQDKAWNDSWDAKYGKMDESMKRVAEVYGTDSMEYAQALKEKEDADKLKADHDEDIEKKRKAADNKYKKGSIATDMVKATAEFAKASFGIWAGETSTKGLMGIPIALALQAMLAASYGTQMGVMAKQMSLVGKMRLGGPVFGPSHESGGVDRNLEGGEFVINAQSMKVPGVAQLANSLNRAGSAGSVPSVVDEASVRAIVNETVGAIAAIPVVVSERDITGTQRRVAVIESKTSF